MTDGNNNNNGWMATMIDGDNNYDEDEGTKDGKVATTTKQNYALCFGR